MSDNYTPEGAPAAPSDSCLTSGGEFRPQGLTGFTARERAAIDLRLPDSGNPWLDEMIAKARKLDMMTALAAGALAGRDCTEATDCADTIYQNLVAHVLEEPYIAFADGTPVTTVQGDSAPTSEDMEASLRQAAIDAEPEPYVPQVGDIVRVIQDNTFFNVGARGRVVRDAHDDTYLVDFDAFDNGGLVQPRPDGECAWWIVAADVALVERSEPVADAKVEAALDDVVESLTGDNAPTPERQAVAARFKVGDIVKPSELGAGYTALDAGSDYRVISVDRDGWLRVVGQDSTEDDIGTWIDGEDVERCND